MRPPVLIRTAGWLSAAAAGALVSACGSSSAPSAVAAPVAKAAPKPRPPVAIGDASTADMSSAVSLVRVSAPVQLKFEVTSHPQPGQPLQVDFAVIPTDPSVAALSARFTGEEGLALVSGAELASVDKPALGVPIRHSVTVLPSAEGIYELNASVTSLSGSDMRTILFSIPVICGAGLPAGSKVAGAGSSATGVKPR